MRSALFCSILVVISFFRIKWNSSQPPVARNSSKWMINANFIPLWEGYRHRSCCWCSEEWKDRVLQVSGGNKKQGFPMKWAILTHCQVFLPLGKGHSCYRPKRTGERNHKSAQGGIVHANMSVLNLGYCKEKKKERKKRKEDILTDW